MGLGVRLPRFCIKVDSNPSEIFSLSRPNPRIRPTSLLFSGSTPDLRRSKSHSLGRREVEEEGFCSRHSMDARDSSIYRLSLLLTNR